MSSLHSFSEVRKIDHGTLESVYNDPPSRGAGLHLVQEQHDDTEETLPWVGVGGMDALDFVRL